ncbi:MAG: HlyC/CorC family transporter [Bacteroidetes bacterium]|nr:MAG: HlyC/CorC family transporter [Bacteroidota bacterium]
METESVVIILSLLFSAFFSGTEIAFISANKLKIELDKQHNRFYAKLFSPLVKRSSDFIAAMLIGNNAALVVYGIYMAKILEPVLMQYTSSSFLILLLQTIISTLLVLFTAEFLPKVLFSVNPNKVLQMLSIPIIIIYYILSPVVRIIVFISNLVLKMLFNTEIKPENPVFGRTDLNNYLRQIADNNSHETLENEVQILQNALEFSQRKVRDCMVPRNEIVAVEVEENIEELRKKFIETGLSKILIYRENIDNIIGFTHSFELFKKPDSIKSILLPVEIFPESMPVKRALELLTKKRKSVAVIVDEYGGTAGMITIEDLIEEIIGEIEDEHDKEQFIEEQIDDDSFRLSARLEIDYVNEKFNLNIPESQDYQTIAGFILNYTEDIPDENEEIEIGDFLIKILKVQENKIEEVLITKKKKD